MVSGHTKSAAQPASVASDFGKLVHIGFARRAPTNIANDRQTIREATDAIIRDAQQVGADRQGAHSRAARICAAAETRAAQPSQ